jgi:A/G-specific adenine glycosylase
VETCVAFACGNVSSLPVKARKTKVRNRYLTYLLLTDAKDRIYLQRRGEGDIWQGLYEPFCHESDAPLTAAEATTLMPELQPVKSVCGFTHQLTHQLLHADAYLVRTGASVPHLPGVWVERDRLQDYAMPRLVLLLIEKIMPL